MSTYSIGEEISISDLPENKMNDSGNLEWVGEGKFAFAHGQYTYTVEYSSVQVTEVYDHENSELIGSEYE